MLDRGYLTPPVQIDAPVASYDFSSLNLQSSNGKYSLEEIEAVLKSQSRITPSIVHNIIEMSAKRKGVLIFTASVRHAKEILKLLPKGESALVIADTESEERDGIVQDFKERKIKYLVNVSVLTTGFDAPHVDVVAILRPTESVTLYQQIVGRGLRLYEGKKDCLVLDYTGVPHDIFQPSIRDRKPGEDCVPVKVSCPDCKHENSFWGITDQKGEVLEHFGDKCAGASENPETGEIVPCGFRYRFQLCQNCGAENDRNANMCLQCSQALEDDDVKLKEAHLAKDTHVMRPDSMYLEKKRDAQGKERLEIRYYDHDGQYVSEIFFFESVHDAKVFHYNFCRMHKRKPEEKLVIRSIDEAVSAKDKFRCPLFVIARKQKSYWKIREKIFR
jgi:DNA repair protein RadD